LERQVLRDHVKPDTIILAVAKAIEAKFDRSMWLELALLTGTRDEILAHPRLLRSLDWGDPDYFGNVIVMVPRVLGEQTGRHPTPSESRPRFPNFKVVEDFLDLPDWLHRSEPDLYAKLYGGPVPVDALQTAAIELGVADVDEHAVRTRRGLHDDPVQAIGSAKELLETVLKSILVAVDGEAVFAQVLDGGESARARADHADRIVAVGNVRGVVHPAILADRGAGEEGSHRSARTGKWSLATRAWSASRTPAQ
jgi:hypothetical protein